LSRLRDGLGKGRRVGWEWKREEEEEGRRRPSRANEWA